ncbi:pyruvate kinase [Henriciella algicola]|uniref:Pyruvate kinase n=1 Tax=Henriciella algicola TaxID=1608422 RepID=A0A399RP66_9PROT|nr:pyruvate kinase [Henriciella algicola]RIJ31777.1 pyruvate kinase [Henriciella algicola]
MTSPRLRGRNAKILATIGPKSASPDAIRLLAEAGADIFRLNFSHGAHETHAAVFNAVRSAEKAMGRPLAILADLQGPKIRVGTFEGGAIKLAYGKTYTLTADESTSAPDTIPVPHPEILSSLEEGDEILCDDGKVRLTVSEAGDTLRVTPAFHATLSDRKGFTVRGKTLPLKSMTDKDREDLAFALDLGVDLVALSFVQSVEDVKEAKAAIGARAPLIAKIEKPGAVTDLDAIIRASDGVMIARGDLGVEFPLEQVPIIQRRIVREAREVGRPVIVATQMLESMIENAAPTRAETGDVATAIYQGVDAVMLSAETAIGRHPPTAVAIMDRIIRATEAAPDYRDSLRQFMGDRDDERVIDIVARAAQSLAFAVKAKALALRTGSARRLAQFAKHRGRYFILYGSSDDARLRRAQLLWGVHPIHVDMIEESDWPRTLMDAADLEGAVAYAAWKGGGDDTAWEMGIRR